MQPKKNEPRAVRFYRVRDVTRTVDGLRTVIIGSLAIAAGLVPPELSLIGAGQGCPRKAPRVLKAG